jgi:hypothetical protein
VSALIPVTVMLLAASVVARLTLELPEATAAWRRIAARALTPLSTATLAALAVCVVWRVLDGGNSGLAVALLLMVGAGVLLLRVAVPEADAVAARPEPVARREPRAPAPAPAPPAASLRPTDGALWAGNRDNDAYRRSGLWRV